MLDACAQIVDEVGYEALTTTLIAERAKVAIGSVYQFFPDKRAVVAALTQRNLDAYVRRLDDRISSGGMSRWVEVVNVALDEYIDMHRNVPGFRTLHFGDVVDLNLLDPDRDNNAVIVDNLGRLLEQHFGMARTDDLAFALSMAVEMADALVKAAFRYRDDGDERILSEAKEIIRDYLDRRVSPGDGSHSAEKST
ncbi:MAG: TetR family transcriptional regulator [Micromonosporaceae bacterium]|nr:TetR family transcriptional regulator [Micromonosporaceae bacterium]